MSYDIRGAAGQNVPMPRSAKTTPPPRPIVCQRLAVVRDALGWVQSQMADWLGMEQGTYKQYETRSVPIPKVIAKIEEYLGIPAIAFLNDTAMDDNKFQALIVNLKEKIASGELNIQANAIIRSYTPSGGGKPPQNREGRMGTETLDYIFGALKRIEAKVDSNTQAIDDLKGAGAPKSGFTKGGSKR